MTNCTKGCDHPEADVCCEGGADFGCVCTDCHPERFAAAQFLLSKAEVENELTYLISECSNELRNLKRFYDDRAIVATADIERYFGRLNETNERLETAFHAMKEAEDARRN